tara:strand:- start:3854 stop:4180 length:327 start_codon:yes stop_codon:yes gene_type:complete
MEIRNQHRRITLFRHDSETHARIVATFKRRAPFVTNYGHTAVFAQDWEHWPQDDHLPMEIWRTPDVAGYLDHHLGQCGYFAVAVAEDGTGDVEHGPTLLHVERKDDNA